MATFRQTERLWSAVVLALLALACGEGPTAPSGLPVPSTRIPTVPPPEPPPPPQPPPPAGMLSGVVYVHTFEGARPRAGIPLDVSPVGASSSPNVTSDADGRYRIPVQDGHILKANVVHDGFSQPCRASVTVTGDSVLDVHLVPTALLSATNLPPTLPVPGPTVSGVVFERTAEVGVRPVPGLEVFMDYADGWVSDPGQRFVTDQNGRYFFCGVKFDEAGWGDGLFVWTSPPAYQLAVQQVRAAGVVDLEVVRR